MKRNAILTAMSALRSKLDVFKKRAADTTVTADELDQIEKDTKDATDALSDLQDQLDALDSDASGDTGSGDTGSNDTSDRSDDDDEDSDDDTERGADPAPTDAQRSRVVDIITRNRENINGAKAKPNENQIRSAFVGALMGTVGHEQLRSLGVESNNGSVIVPTSIAHEIITYTEEENLLRKYGSGVSTKGLVSYPVLVKKADAAGHANEYKDGESVPETDIQLDEILLEPSEFDAMARVTKKLVAMGVQGINIEATIVEELSKAYARKEAQFFFQGNDPKNPNERALAKKAGEFFRKVDLTAEGWTQKLYPAFVALKRKVPVALRKKARWFTNSAGMALLETMVDVNGNPLLHDANDGMGQKFLNYPIDETEHVDVTDVDTPVFYFGDMSAFHFQDVQGSMTVQKLVEKYSDQNQIGYQVYNLVDGGLIYSPLEVPVFRYVPTEDAPEDPASK
jgi:HK97 family phage major capsid protein